MADTDNTSAKDTPDPNDIPSLEDLFQPSTEVFCEFGDVSLNVDDGYHPATKIRVSSCILATASPVFKALFSANFSEGKALRSDAGGNKPTELTMSDRAADMRNLCKLLHFRDSLGPMSAREFFGLSLIIDKYDCAAALYRFTHGVFLEVKDSLCLDVNTIIYYIAAAYLLDDAMGFQKFTKMLVLQAPSMFLSLEDERTDVLPSTILLSIQAQRACVFQDLARQLSIFLEHYTNSAFALDAPNYSRKLAHRLSLRKLLPLDSTSASLNDCLESIALIYVPVMLSDPYPRSQAHMLPREYWTDSLRAGWKAFGCNMPNHPDVNYEGADDVPPRPASTVYTAPYGRVEPPGQQDLQNIVNATRDKCAGLCLDCLRKNPGYCRVPHTAPWYERELLPEDMGWAYDLTAGIDDDGDDFGHYNPDWDEVQWQNHG